MTVEKDWTQLLDSYSLSIEQLLADNAELMAKLAEANNEIDRLCMVVRRQKFDDTIIARLNIRRR